MERKDRLTYEIAILVKEREATEAWESASMLLLSGDDSEACEAAIVECLRESAHLASLRLRAAQTLAAEDMERAISLASNGRSDEWIQATLAGMGVKWMPAEPTEAPAPTDPEVQS